MLEAIGKRYVVETGQTENGWFTRYSDGWIEQGGYISGNGFITFPVAFSTTNINLTFGLRTGNGVPRSTYDPTQTGFNYGSANEANSNAYYRACGF